MALFPNMCNTGFIVLCFTVNALTMPVLVSILMVFNVAMLSVAK